MSLACNLIIYYLSTDISICCCSITYSWKHSYCVAKFEISIDFITDYTYQTSIYAPNYQPCPISKSLTFQKLVNFNLLHTSSMLAYFSILLYSSILFSMNSSKPKRDAGKFTSCQKLDRENVDPQWNVENQQLESEAEANSRLRQQITKESYADFAVQANIKDKITFLKEKAVQIAQTLESEKRKNVELNAIIRHMNFAREEQKNIEASHRDDISYENVDNLFRKIKKSEYDLEQMFSKLNDLTSKNKQRKSEVDTYRTQRVIDSGIFLKIEKEILQSQTQYKKLLIEKTRFEQQYRKNLQNYKRMKNDIEKEQEVNLSQRQTNSQKQDNQQRFFMNIPNIEHAVKFTEINEGESKRKSFLGSRNFLMVEAKKQQHHQEVEIAVKRVFVQTGLSSVESLVDYFHNIESVNEKLYAQVNSGTDKICELHRRISQLQQKKEQKTIKYYESEPQLTKTEKKIKDVQQIEDEVRKTNLNASKLIKQLEYFIKTNEIRQLSTLMGIQFPAENEMQCLQQFFSNLENQLSPLLLNYGSFQQDSEEGLRVNRESDMKQDTIQDLINKVKRMQESEKIMVKQDFKKQYQKILKSEGSKGRAGKKKTTFVRKH